MQPDYGRYKWYSKWCEPIVLALYKRERSVADVLLEDMHNALASGELAGDDHGCVSYFSAYLRFQRHLKFKDRKHALEELDEILSTLNKPAGKPYMDAIRLRLLIQLRIHLDRLDILPLKPVRFDSLFNELDEHEQTTELWFYISGWAFRHRQVEHLEHAYAFSVLQAQGFHVNWNWQRVNIMLKLVRGDAMREDLLWLIDNVSLEQNLHSIQKDILPLAYELGLVDKQMELRLQERQYELKKEGQITVDRVLQPFIKGHAGMQPTGG